MMLMALWLLIILVPAQMLIGDQHGLNTLEHQPAKLAAMEARWETVAGAADLCSRSPTRRPRPTHFAIEMPVLGSLILTHDPNGTCRA